MELNESILNRHSCRFFQKRKKVDNELILDILQVATLAPSAKNRQPWRFAVATGKLKDHIVKMMIDKATEQDFKDYERKNWNSNSSVKNTARAMGEAPVLILIFKRKDMNWNIGDNLSIGACVEHMCLRATDLGLGSLWIRDTYAIEDELCAMMKSKNLELICALSIGYSKNVPMKTHRKKFGNNFVQFKKTSSNDLHKQLCALNSKNKINK